VPFTGSHPAAVLPLMRSGLVPSALVIGSMVPDLFYYLPLSDGIESQLSHHTHTAVGVLGLDLVLGLAVFVIWQVLVAPLAVAVAGQAVRARLAPGLPVPWRRHFAGLRAAGTVLVSLWVGAATHVFWDEFTHPGRWGARHLSWLADSHGPLAGYQWAQYASGVVGALLIADAVRRWWQHTPVAARPVEGPVEGRADLQAEGWPDLQAGVDGHGPAPQRVLSRSGLIAVVATIVVAGLAGASAGAVHDWQPTHSIHDALFGFATWGGGATLFAILTCALINAYPAKPLS
jgi:hypothetical protein